MTTTLSILILAIAAICVWRRLRRNRSRAAAGNASSSLPILTDEEMERMLEENDRVYEQLMADGRALQAMFASHDAQLVKHDVQQAKEANSEVANPTPPKRRIRPANSTKPRKPKLPRIKTAAAVPVLPASSPPALILANHGPHYLKPRSTIFTTCLTVLRSAASMTAARIAAARFFRPLFTPQLFKLPRVLSSFFTRRLPTSRQLKPPKQSLAAHSRAA